MVKYAETYWNLENKTKKSFSSMQYLQYRVEIKI
jgi:hypothetical protein